MEVSPSTVIWLKLVATWSLSNSCNNLPSTLASVTTKPSIVAILGWIIPDPLQKPVITHFWPACSNSKLIVLGWVSVVRIASVILWLAVNFKALIPASNLAIGKNSPITPVEATPTNLGLIPSLAATSSCSVWASTSPWAPVKELATALLTTSAWSWWPCSIVCLVKAVGAAQNWLVVYTPAALAGTCE